MFLMIIVTGFVTGVLNACFFPHPLLGASGVVFMMILLASFTNNGKDEIPLTFILIVILYLGREILDAFKGDDISQFAHLVGGFCGSLFGFFKPSRISQTKRRKALEAQSVHTTKASSSAGAIENRSSRKQKTETGASAPVASTPKSIKTDAAANRQSTQDRPATPKKTTATMKIAAPKRPRKVD